MEVLNYVFGTKQQIHSKAWAGVAGSGNLEVLMEPSTSETACVEVTTSLDSTSAIWQCVLERFFQENPVSVHVEINDCGATPGVVNLRLLQVLEKIQDQDRVILAKKAVGSDEF